MSKFYPLETNEWLEASEELKLSELRVLYYLRTLDPFGQHPVKFRVIDLAESLKCSKGTISKAIQKLGTLGYINLEIVEAIATLTTKSKKFSTENQVSYEKQSTENIGFLQKTKFPTGNLDILQETSTSYRKPDDLQTGSGQSTVFSKINIDQLEDLRDHDLVFFENKIQENLVSIDDPISNQIVPTVDDLKPVIKSEDRISPVKVINPIDGDSPRRALEDFILKSMSFAPRDRTAYFSKFGKADWEKWEAKFKPPSSQVFVSNIFVPEIVEIADPDSPKVREAIAQIKAALGIKEKSKCS